jgi:hypothetical protein
MLSYGLRSCQRLEMLLSGALGAIIVPEAVAWAIWVIEQSGRRSNQASKLKDTPIKISQD